jgi:hypothetical protein
MSICYLSWDDNEKENQASYYYMFIFRYFRKKNEKDIWRTICDKNWTKKSRKKNVNKKDEKFLFIFPSFLVVIEDYLIYYSFLHLLPILHPFYIYVLYLKKWEIIRKWSKNEEGSKLNFLKLQLGFEYLKILDRIGNR